MLDPEEFAKRAVEIAEDKDRWIGKCIDGLAVLKAGFSKDKNSQTLLAALNSVDSSEKVRALRKDRKFQSELVSNSIAWKTEWEKTLLLKEQNKLLIT